MIVYFLVLIKADCRRSGTDSIDSILFHVEGQVMLIKIIKEKTKNLRIRLNISYNELLLD